MARLLETQQRVLDTLANPAGPHPNLASHDELGLATQAELNTIANSLVDKADAIHAHPVDPHIHTEHALTVHSHVLETHTHADKADALHAHDLAYAPAVHTHAGVGLHPDLTAHDLMGLATQSELNAVAQAKADIHAHPYAPSSHSHAIGDLPTGTTATTVALGNHTHGAAGGPATVKLTADLAAKSTTTLADVTGLVFPLVAGTYYRFVFHVLFFAGATATGIRLGLTTPAFTVYSAHVRVPAATADGTAGMMEGFLSTSGDSVVGANTPGTTKANSNLGVIEGSILPSANGNLQVQYAPEVAAALTVLQGSNGTLFSL